MPVPTELTNIPKLNDWAAAMATYQEFGDRINAYLATGKVYALHHSTREKIAETIAALDTGISKHKLMDDAVVFRGTSKKRLPGGTVPDVGQTFTTPGYASTSYELKTALGFAEDKSIDGENVVIRYHLKAGQNAVLLNGLSHSTEFRNEREILLPRGIQSTVIGREFDSKTSTWFIDVITSPP